VTLGVRSADRDPPAEEAFVTETPQPADDTPADPTAEPVVEPAEESADPYARQAGLEQLLGPEDED
jgi:hypothetical protein